jgi:hypothetical protein
MPPLTFPITPDGLTLSVRVNLDGAALTSLIAAGQPPPPSVNVTAVIDTGSNASGVAPWVLQQLGAPVHFNATTQGIGGSVGVRMFMVTLFLLDINRPHLPWLPVPDLLVMELPPHIAVDVLVGMDILRTCKMLVDGPAGHFMLDF